MSTLPTINQEYLREVLIDLLQTPSPTGYTEAGILKVQQYLEELGFSPLISPKADINPLIILQHARCFFMDFKSGLHQFI